MEKTQQIKSELSQEIGWLTINRPQLSNAISTAMWKEIPEAIATLKGDGARAIVVRGSDSCFAAGADLSELKAITTWEHAESFWYAIREALDFVATIEVPTIAAIDGPCIGGGCLLALACDLRYASNTAVFGIPVARLGIVLDDDNIARLTHLVGPAHARELLFLGETITAQEALDRGLINACLKPGDVTRKVDEVARKVLLNGYASIAESKKSVLRSILPLERSGLIPQHESVVISSYLTSDFRKRVAETGE